MPIQPLTLAIEFMSEPALSPPPDSSTSTVSSKEERLWAMLAHLSGFLGHFLPGIGNIAGPLVIWILKKDRFAFVDDQAKEALNFQISATIYCVLVPALVLGLCFLLIGFLLLP